MAYDTDRIFRLIDDKEVSRLTGLSRHRLQTLRVRGGGPAFVKIGHSVRYRVSEIESWLTKNQQSFTGKQKESLTSESGSGI